MLDLDRIHISGIRNSARSFFSIFVKLLLFLVFRAGGEERGFPG
jgi:hypothetical protein